MLRSMIFNCTSTHPHPIVCGGEGWGGLGWDKNVIGISTWTWCYALWSSLAFPHELDATLYDLHWHFHMILMLRSMIFIGVSTWTWCYALWSAIAIPHELDATLYDLQLHFHTSASDSLGRGGGGVGWDKNVIGISTWTWCYALWSSLTFPHELDATLYDLHWHFHMILMLRSTIFIGISTWTWLLRSMIFNCNSTWTWCYALWSSLAFPHELDATLYHLQCEKKLRLPLFEAEVMEGSSFPK